MAMPEACGHRAEWNPLVVTAFCDVAGFRRREKRATEQMAVKSLTSLPGLPLPGQGKNCLLGIICCRLMVGRQGAILRC